MKEVVPAFILTKNNTFLKAEIIGLDLTWNPLCFLLSLIIEKYIIQDHDIVSIIDLFKILFEKNDLSILIYQQLLVLFSRFIKKLI